MTGLCMVALMGFAALVIDIGFGLVTKNQLQNVADAAALAGTNKLGQIYIALSENDQTTYQLSTLDRADIIAEIASVAQLNYAAGKAMTINDADVQIGQ